MSSLAKSEGSEANIRGHPFFCVAFIGNIPLLKAWRLNSRSSTRAFTLFKVLCFSVLPYFDFGFRFTIKFCHIFQLIVLIQTFINVI